LVGQKRPMPPAPCLWTHCAALNADLPQFAIKGL
jgi:hypothetical protein